MAPLYISLCQDPTRSQAQVESQPYRHPEQLLCINSRKNSLAIESTQFIQASALLEIEGLEKIN
ncbi:hypothetical protein PCASD_11407 [Puccinia coronata f. sp. avenae]|uniref:Uncharacterized protein n=1 Tax=Puccinia coronata f. sp. avenae TaxID=200324 RepID=A0A2N5V0Y2_9BASI|nr:hypothetical protein PCASD_11407 [Puccinia coronata f. sp. avenae]